MIQERGIWQGSVFWVGFLCIAFCTLSLHVHTTVLSAMEVRRGANDEVAGGERMVTLELEEPRPWM